MIYTIYSVPTLLFTSCFQALFISSICVSQNYPWSYQSWGWHSNCWIMRSVHSHSGSTSRYACVARSPGVSCWGFRHIGTFLAWLPMKNWFTQARLSQEVFLALIKSWCATIQYCCLLRSSSKPRGTHRIPQIRSRFWLTGLGIRIHHYKKRSVNQEQYLSFPTIHINSKHLPLPTSLSQTTRWSIFNLPPVLPFWTKTIQWNIHPYHPLHQRHHPRVAGPSKPPSIRGLRFCHHRSQGKRRSPLWFLPYQWG